MNTKKTSAAWYVAATHYLTSIFLPNILAGLIGALVLIKFSAQLTPIAQLVIIEALMLVAMYLGVRHSASYIARTYVVPSASKIVSIAMIYIVVLDCLYYGLRLASLLAMPAYMLIQIGLSVLTAVLFYILSKRYLRDDAGEIMPAGSNVSAATNPDLFPKTYSTPAPAPAPSSPATPGA